MNLLLCAQRSVLLLLRRPRLGFQERLARNARVSTDGPVTIRMFGVPAAFAASLEWATA
ncbi:MAG TPA: hypothetical protein VFA09_27555 [Ktedonobacteraceae bacterium]|nr:hypothetical protein [Ktedonobacteraceae bacterium]